MKVYVVHMQRWGDPELHSYIIGVYRTQLQAEVQGLREKEWRANKYEPKIIEVELDAPYTEKCDECDALCKPYDTCVCKNKSGAW